MEILFMGQWSSTESLLVFLILAILFAYVVYDIYRYFKPAPIVATPTPLGEEVGAFTITRNIPELPQETPIGPDEEISKTPPMSEEKTDVGVTLISQDTPSKEENPTLTNSPTPETIGSLVSVENTSDTHEETLKIEESILPEELQVEETEYTVNAQENPLIETNDTITSESKTTSDVLDFSPPSIIVEEGETVASNTSETLVELAVSPAETSESQLSKNTQLDENTQIVTTPHDTVIPTSVSSDNGLSRAPEHGETLFAITNNVRTLIARGQTLEARGLIIQGLALEKNHRELNIMLASLYEQEHQFEKAEFIYKDLALMYPNDIDLLEKLGNVLIISRRYDIALEMYKKILTLAGETEGTLYILSHIAKELEEHDLAYEYTRKYQKQWPNNPEILTILAQVEIALGNRKDAIQTLIKLKNLTPYNQEITDMIQKLVLEEELAGNFGAEKIM